MKQVQWFPGHMAKALNQMQGQIDSVDIVIEILDARIPFSSANPEVEQLAKKKPTLVILSKKDLADENITNQWINYFESNNQVVIASDIAKLDFNKVKAKCNDVLKEKREKDRARGIKDRPIRALIVGIPNVGKSTFINKLAKRKAAIVENRPGVTKSAQYIKVDKDFVLVDTPGVLWPNFEDKQVGINLALIGSIKQTILPNDELAVSLLNLLTNNYTGTIEKNYGVKEFKTESYEDCFKLIDTIGLNKKFITSNNQVDIDRTIMHLLREFANGKLGKFSLEVPNGR